MLGEQEQEEKAISTPTLLVACVFMSLPPVIPLYFAWKAEDPTLQLIFALTGITMLVANAGIVVLVVRWLTRMMD